MTTRSYGQTCSLAGALDLLGERWTLLLVRELMTGPKRFKDLLPGLQGIGTNLLAARLRTLSEQGLVETVSHPASARARAYRLSAAGRALEPVVLELVRWGLRFQRTPEPDSLYRPEWTAVALRAVYAPADPPADPIRVQLRVGGSELFAIASRRGIETGLGPLADPDVTVVCSTTAFRGLEAGHPTARLVATGEFQILGDAALFERFRALFVLPVPETTVDGTETNGDPSP